MRLTYVTVSRTIYARALLIAAAMFLFLGQVHAILDPPAPRCASVNVAGDVTLTWTTPPDPFGEFASYQVYWSTDAAGPFVALPDILVPGQTTLFHPTPGALAGPVFYYMTSVSVGPAPNTSVPSDTISTLFLQVSQSTPLGSADLAWSAPALPPTADPGFSVWMEYPVGTWVLLVNVPAGIQSYRHAITVCEDSLTFRVSYTDASGCTAFSSRDGEVFRDVTPPSVPIVVTVSVDSLTGLSTIDWDPSPETDTDGYIIVLNTPGGGIIIDTVFGQNNTYFEWLASLPGEGVESFTIAAFDTCFTGVPPSPNTSATGPAHSTLYASTTYDRCAALVRLQWSAYVGWPVQSHQILMQVDGGAWSVLANVAGTQLQFTHAVEAGRTYCYVIKAIRDGTSVSSLSNKTCRFTDYPATAASNYLRTVTVTGPQQITVVDSTQSGTQVSAFLIERSANGGDLEPQATLPGSVGNVFSWVDNDVDPSTTGYRYKVSVLDSCGRPAATSNEGGNLVLRATPGLDGVNRLAWNGYAVWAGITATHVVYRSIDDGPFEAIATLPPDPWNYEDDVQAFTGTTGKFCYVVQAVEAANPSGLNATSESNAACAVQEELVYIPNAFIVGGFNNVFRPVISYADVTEYQLSIINRWGQIIWTTDDPAQAWNGIVGSSYVPIGVYGYYCSFSNGAGKRIVKNGTVTMLTADP